MTYAYCPVLLPLISVSAGGLYIGQTVLAAETIRRARALNEVDAAAAATAAASYCKTKKSKTKSRVALVLFSFPIYLFNLRVLVSFFAE